MGAEFGKSLVWWAWGCDGIEGVRCNMLGGGRAVLESKHLGEGLEVGEVFLGWHKASLSGDGTR